MAKKKAEIVIPQEVLMRKIYEIRGQKVMLDSDLAELYQVETRVLNQAVKRNLRRFPEDFMFELSQEEWANLISQFVTSSQPDGNVGWGGRRKLPLVFTEQGVAMLSSVLNSETAIDVNIQIMRLFTKMREMISNHQEIFKQLEEIRSNVKGHDEQLQMIFAYLKQFENAKKKEFDQDKRERIGFKPKK